MKISTLSGKVTNRHAISHLLVVLISLSTLLAFSSGEALAAPPGGRPITSLEKDIKDAGASPAGPMTLTLNNASAGVSDQASISFTIGSYSYTRNGILYTMDVAPFISNNRAYLPLRYMGYAIGMSDNDISWNPQNKTAAVRFDNHTVVFALSSTTYTIDGVAHTMDAEPVIVKDYMNIPARYVADAFGYNVSWQANPILPADLQLDPPPDAHGMFAVVDTRIPEHLYVYHDTSVVLATYCNTGIPAAPTPTGVFRVLTKKAADDMAGTNPDGSHYFDPGVPWVMYFYGGDAIHGFVRARYGFPQSLGCVELPVATAKRVYDLLPAGAKVYIRKW